MSTPINDIQTLLKKEMSRKEFLRIVGAGFLGIVGVTTALQNIQKVTGTHNASTPQQKTSMGYGSSPYGR